MTESLFAFKDVLDHVLYEIILEAMLINKPSLSLSLSLIIFVLKTFDVKAYYISLSPSHYTQYV